MKKVGKSGRSKDGKILHFQGVNEKASTVPSFAFTSIGLMWNKKATARPSFALTSIGLMWNKKATAGKKEKATRTLARLTANKPQKTK